MTEGKKRKTGTDKLEVLLKKQSELATQIAVLQREQRERERKAHAERMVKIGELAASAGLDKFPDEKLSEAFTRIANELNAG